MPEELNPDTISPPMQVNQSAAAAQVGGITRQAIIFIAVLPSLVALFGKHDVTELVNYIASAEFAPAVAFLLPIAVVWGQWVIRRVHAQKVFLARKVDDSIATVR